MTDEAPVSASLIPKVKVVLTERPDGGPRRPLAAVCELGGKIVFVPAEIPCGECGPCRRALVSFCVARVAWLGLDLKPKHPIAARFTYEFDPSGVSEVHAPWAALLLPWLEAMGRSGLGAGDLSFWLGESPIVLLGAFLASARGSDVIVSGSQSLSQALAQLADVGVQLAPRFAPLDALDDRALQAYVNGPSGFRERYIFAQSNDPVVWSSAGNLLAPGSTFVVFGGLPALAGLPPDARIFTLGPNANPDFAFEALTALSRDPALLQICERLQAAGAFELVAVHAVA